MAPGTLLVGGREERLPTFFPSISSIKTNLHPLEYLQLLSAVNEPRLLISAYDIANARGEENEHINRAVSAAVKGGATVLLDSGNYEKYWKGDRTWTRESLSQVLSATPAQLAFSYDDQSPPEDPIQAAEEIVATVVRDQEVAPRSTVCPIVHGRPEDISRAVGRVAGRLQPLVLAVAERELGDGIVARARTLKRVCSELEDASPGTCLHVLGTGNPIGILVYAIAGARSFDGLEWCQTCVDPDTALLHHFQHLDLVDALGTPISLGLPYVARTLIHNLAFYRQWMSRVQESVRTGTSLDLLRSVLPAAGRSDVATAIGAL
jgi:queuine/archaeosine tRNA-ribosyltransferase